jgi:2-polyprenyl-6-methoxyphenol hydroxylase-like FAD-dependent oxidoreductase
VFIPTPLQDQLDRARTGSLRVLVVGAGVAGLTLAQRLRAAGLSPALVERACSHADAGYMLALMPFVDPVIRRIGVDDAYRDASVRLRRYGLHGHTGKLLREYAMGDLFDDFGDYRGIARGELLQVLAHTGAAVSYDTTLAAVRQTPDAAIATLECAGERTEADFDVVVLADGLHSDSRALVLRPDQVADYDSRWGGWVAWSASDAATADLGDEVWGADFFIGVYPVKGRDGIFIGGNREDTRDGPAAFVARVRKRLRHVDPRIERALAAVVADDDPYYWSLTDIRSSAWSVGRVALLGDAAAGFLPTAGIGAAMAMESAEALAQHLLAAKPGNVPQALRDYEQAQRPRVESAQDNSRALARMMFHRSRLLAILRDVIARFLTLKAALGPIRKLLETAPEAHNESAR